MSIYFPAVMMESNENVINLYNHQLNY